ncbi:hypothetical protein OPT61_g3503 [Boeremia exigua]|uniref:Uncharacterized protein n=1 Tax=Boeremia exigua TaxID=749465 RepID=A0ACC2IHP3_9PLEO|nr:hypothetical protein OPT61_g3503 [Boeremia exigua]
MGKAFDDVGNVLVGGGARLRESHAHDAALELHVAGGNGVRLDPRLDLSSWVGDLGNEQRPVPLRLCRHVLERLEALPREFGLAGDDGVAGPLEMVVLDHDISREDESNAALAPSPVQVDEVLGRYTASLQVLRVPAGQALSHSSLEEAVGCSSEILKPASGQRDEDLILVLDTLHGRQFPRLRRAINVGRVTRNPPHSGQEDVMVNPHFLYKGRHRYEASGPRSRGRR